MLHLIELFDRPVHIIITPTLQTEKLGVTLLVHVTLSLPGRGQGCPAGHTYSPPEYLHPVVNKEGGLVDQAQGQGSGYV
jgi:hypothetical protein